MREILPPTDRGSWSDPANPLDDRDRPERDQPEPDLPEALPGQLRWLDDEQPRPDPDRPRSGVGDGSDVLPDVELPDDRA